MANFSELIVTIPNFLLPVVVVMLPGIAFVSREDNIWFATAKTILWSLVINILATLILAAAGISSVWVLMIISLLTVVFIVKNRKNYPKHIAPIVSTALAAFFVIYLLFSMPFLTFHLGLPTGDSQKAFFWAQQINETNQLPRYTISKQQLNRDPSDFFTPGLHTLTAFITKHTPNPLTATGFLAIALGIASATLAGAIMYQIVPKSKVIAPTFAIILTLTQIRFLRYLREPGYHFQNILGELILFGLIFLCLSLIQKPSKQNMLLIILLALILPLTHQFTAFLSAFLLVPSLITLALQHKEQIKKYKIIIITGALLCLLTFLVAGLPARLAHFFTTTPHLLPLTPNLADYSSLMGLLWLLIGIVGLAYIFKTEKSRSSRAFLVTTVVLLTLSQAPRLGIDIPPVRTLFYAAIPVSVTGAAFLTALITRKKLITISFALILLFTTSYTSVINAYQLSHASRTNATLSPSIAEAINQIEKNNETKAILADSYNDQSTTWLLLAKKPTFIRIAANIERQMQEANQSPERRELYLKHLDYEKIFSLGSHPGSQTLLNKHNISLIAAEEKTSATSLAHNPNLIEQLRANNIIFYATRNNTKVVESAWLLQATTLVNDIGDNEDTFEHLPASLRSSRLSNPIQKNSKTYRITTAPLVPLKFNIGDYVQTLWDKENTGMADTTLRFELALIDPETEISVIDHFGVEHELTKNGSIYSARLKPSDVPFDEKGFVTITLKNPRETPIAIDMIALGLDLIP